MLKYVYYNIPDNQPFTKDIFIIDKLKQMNCLK